MVFLAPFGLPSGAAEILEKENLLEEYTILYRSWEDLFSRKIYARRGIPDDRVAATIHRYLEVKKDQKVLSAIQEASAAMNVLIEPSNSIELPEPFNSSSTVIKYLEEHSKTDAKEYSSKNSGEHSTEHSSEHAAEHSSDYTEQIKRDIINTPQTAATLLRQVKQGIERCFPHLKKIKNDENNVGEECTSSSLPSSSSSSSSDVLENTINNCSDKKILTHLGINVPIRILSPGMFGNIYLSSLCLSDSSIEFLKNVLCVKIELESGKIINRDFNLQQYYTLLNLYGESIEVKNVISEYAKSRSEHSSVHSLDNSQEHSSVNFIENSSADYSQECSESSKECSEEYSDNIGLEELQCGALGLSLSVHPTVAYVLLLKSIISKSTDKNKGALFIFVIFLHFLIVFVVTVIMISCFYFILF